MQDTYMAVEVQVLLDDGRYSPRGRGVHRRDTFNLVVGQCLNMRGSTRGVRQQRGHIHPLFQRGGPGSSVGASGGGQAVGGVRGEGGGGSVCGQSRVGYRFGPEG